MGQSVGVKTEYWLQNPFDLCSDISKWANDLLKDDDAPLVHSMSYGEQNPEGEICADASQIATIEAQFAKLAAKGLTLIVSSGDSGSGWIPVDDKCGGVVELGDCGKGQCSYNVCKRSDLEAVQWRLRCLSDVTESAIALAFAIVLFEFVLSWQIQTQQR